MSIYKKISDNSKQFETPEEFLKFYDKNKDSIDETNTKALNLKYKIIDHKIGRKNGKIIIYPLSNISLKESNFSNPETDSDITSMKKEITKLRNDVNKLIEAYQEIISVLGEA